MGTLMFRQLANGGLYWGGQFITPLSIHKNPPAFHRTNYFNKELFQQKQKQIIRP